MDSFFERLIQELDNRKHLNALFPNRPIMIKFVCDKEEWGLYISKNSCSIMKKDIGESNLEIHASKPILCHLLNGHIRLSQLVKNNELTYICALIKRGGGKCPMKPGNRQISEMVPIHTKFLTLEDERKVS